MKNRFVKSGLDLEAKMNELDQKDSDRDYKQYLRGIHERSGQDL